MVLGGTLCLFQSSPTIRKHTLQSSFGLPQKGGVLISFRFSAPEKDMQPSAVMSISGFA